MKTKSPFDEASIQRIVWPVVGGAGALGLCLAMLGPRDVLRPSVILIGGAGWVAGACLRNGHAAARDKHRRELIGEELPVALDLLTLSVMSGEAIPAAFSRVGRLLAGEVGCEFRAAADSMRTGMPVDDALGSLVDTLPHPGVPRLVDALRDAIERGAPVAETLRSQADDIREARRRRLLELGGRREVAMMVPVVFLILPTLIVFSFLPGLVSLDLLVP